MFHSINQLVGLIIHRFLYTNCIYLSGRNVLMTDKNMVIPTIKFHQHFIETRFSRY